MDRFSQSVQGNGVCRWTAIPVVEWHKELGQTNLGGAAQTESRKETSQNFLKALADRNADHYLSRPSLTRPFPNRNGREKKVRDGLTDADNSGYHVGPNSTGSLESDACKKLRHPSFSWRNYN
jgi:hypothetical protein